MRFQIVGVDCATQPKKVGLALARQHEAGWRLERAVCSPRPAAEVASEWIRSWEGRTLLALDAPLGWPAALAETLHRHAAGEPLSRTANELFRRGTDRDIAQRFRKTPLDVGADRIARTAHWALELLEDLRRRVDEPVPLAWSESFAERVAAIEVYPAATLLAHGVAIAGYKVPAGDSERQAIHVLLTGLMDCEPAGDPKDWSIDALDAAVCVVAAVDFLAGRAAPPLKAGAARKEGWIWAKGTA